MSTIRRLLSTAFLLLGLTASQEAAPSRLLCTDANPTIGTLTDLTTLSSCLPPMIHGNLILSPSFPNAVFLLPNISFIGNTFYIDKSPSASTTLPLSPAITEISMPDLQFVIEGMNLEGLSRLHRFDMPMLRSVGEGRQGGGSSPEVTRITTTNGAGWGSGWEGGEDKRGALEFSFPVLESVGVTWFEGNIGKIDMPSLKTAKFMMVNSTAEFDCNALVAQLKDVNFQGSMLECHSNANINTNKEQDCSVEEESNTSDNSSYLSRLGEMATQLVLKIGRFVV